MSAGDRGGLLGLGIFRPVGMAMVVLAVTVFGVVSLGKLPVDLLPPIDYPSITVRTVYPGAAPEDLEERVTERMEDALSTVGGLVRLRSSSRAEVSEVLMEFEWGVNLPLVVQDVRERLDRVFLPSGVERPLILRYDPSLDPILRVALSGGRDLVRLRDTAEREIERELEGLTGVAAVKVRGGLEDEIQVRLDPRRFATYRVPPEVVLQRLAEENLNVPGGTLEEGSVEYVVRTLNEFRTLEEIEELPILVRGDRFIKLRDIAEVARTHKDRDVILRVAGKEAVEIDIYREAGANIVETSRLVKERLFGTPEQQAYWAAVARAKRTASASAASAEASEMGGLAEADAEAGEMGGEPPPADEEPSAAPSDQAESGEAASSSSSPEADAYRLRMSQYIARKLPGDMGLTLLSDQAQFVRGAIDEVRDAGMVGGFLAILICFLFLRRVSSTFVVGLSIPISILATFGPMYLFGVSLNVMSLGGLALGIGMLVDNTIVVLESITRCREEGDPPLEAALRGVREVGSAVIASTLTTVAVFAPIVFVEGIAGQTFGDQALTVVSSLAISLAVALFFIPGLAARLERSRRKKGAPAAAAPAAAPAPAPAAEPRQRWAFLRGLRHPRRWWSWLLAVLLIAGGVAALGALGTLQQQALSELPVLTGPTGEVEPPDPADLSADVQAQLSLVRLVAAALFMGGLWWLMEYLLLLFGRTMFQLLRVGAFAVKWIAAGVMLVFGILLAPFSYAVSGLLNLAARAYPVFLKGALRASAVVIVLVAVAGFFAWRSLENLGQELLPEVLQGELTAELYFPAGYPLEETDLLALGLEQRLRALDGVVESAVVSGSDRESISTDEEGPHTARITLRIRGGDQSRALEQRVEGEIRALLAAEPALARFEIRRPTLLTLHAPLEIEVLGNDLAEVGRVARRIETALREVPGILDLRSSVRRGNPEVRIVLDRDRLAEHNLKLAEVANRLRTAVEGQVASTFPGLDDRIDIRVRVDLSMMEHVDQIRDMPVNPGDNKYLPLGAVATLTIVDGPSDIRHINGRRAAVLAANTGGFDLGGITAEVEKRLGAIEAPAGITFRVAGQKREMEESLDSLFFALALAVFLVYAVMAAQFESLLQPFLIMFAVPLAAVGALVAMDLTGTSISVVALLGGVVLAGIVVNNAIVLVDRINRNRGRGLPLEEAIIEAGRARLRPILMTTVTTVLGMLPLTGWLVGLPLIGSIGAAEGTELRAPMALVVIAGLVTSTLLTLVVIPVFYRLLALATERARHA